MYILSLTYKASLQEVDAELENHVRFLKKQYALGHFEASGRKVPRTGGVILSLMEDRAALEQVIQQDPFHQKGIAVYEIIEFIPSMTSDKFKSLL